MTTVPDPSRLHGQASDFVAALKDTHEQVSTNLSHLAQKYKFSADSRRREVIFEPGDLVWVVLTKDRMPLHEYNKLRSRKIRPIQIIERINNNAYRLQLPPDIKTANVFNVKYLKRYLGNDVPDSETNLFLAGGT